MAGRAFLAVALALLACSAPAQQTKAEPEGIRAEFTEATYGTFAITTSPGAKCDIEVELATTQLGDPLRRRVSVVADANGVARAEFRPRRSVPSGDGTYAAFCALAGDHIQARTRFAVTELPFVANDLTVRIAAFEVMGTPADPALEPLRARAIEALGTQLVRAWATATRGLGAVSIVEQDADLVMRVVAARGMSVHRRARDGSHDVILFVGHPQIGAIDVENIVAIALHELGHVWCCFGPGTTAGHWDVPEADPALGGLDRYGLMNHPVVCRRLATGFLSCPDRFSERELREMKLIQ